MRALARRRWLNGMFTNYGKRLIWQVGWHPQIIQTDGGSVLLLTSSSNINYLKVPHGKKQYKTKTKQSHSRISGSADRKNTSRKRRAILVNTTIVKEINSEQTGDAHFEIEDMNFFERKHSDAFDEKKTQQHSKALISVGS